MENSLLWIPILSAMLVLFIISMVLYETTIINTEIFANILGIGEIVIALGGCLIFFCLNFPSGEE
jgi:hypothetical protein